MIITLFTLHAENGVRDSVVRNRCTNRRITQESAAGMGEKAAETTGSSSSSSATDSRPSETRDEGVRGLGAERQGNDRETFNPWKESAKLFSSYQSTSSTMDWKHFV